MDAKQVLQDTTASPPVEPLHLSVDPPPRISLWRFVWIWFLLGLQSFGGGTATLFLIRRAAVEQHKWVPAEEFARDWALVQAAPGINLLGMTILVGHRVAGFTGGALALVGLMLPSVTLTIVMTALYADLRNLPVVQAALHGIVPATVGLGLVLTVRMVLPLLAARGREGRGIQAIYVLILFASAVAILLWELPVIYILCAAGLIGGLSQWFHATQTHATQTQADKGSQP